MVNHIEPDILECEVKWALRSTTVDKASGDDGIPADLFQILTWCCSSAALNMPANLENWAVATGLEKVNFHSNPKEGQCQRISKLSFSCTDFTLARLCSKSFKLGFNSTWNENLQMYRLDFKKTEEPEIKLSTSTGS